MTSFTNLLVASMEFKLDPVADNTRFIVSARYESKALTVPTDVTAKRGTRITCPVGSNIERLDDVQL